MGLLYTGTRKPLHLRSIHVRAMGNDRQKLGPGASNLHTAVTYYFRELWGHTLFVTAVDPKTGLIADYANYCGDLPPDWNEYQFGRHFCVAAPGTFGVAKAGGGFERASGTSFASAYVAAVLGELYVRCRVSGTQLVKLLLDTADRRPPYNDRFRYGAGMITRERSVRACM